MDKLWPTVLIVVIVALLFIAMWVGWQHRARRDAALHVPGTLPHAGRLLMTVQALHVGSTHHDRPLDRVVVPGLAFRARAVVTISDTGITMTAPGESSVAIAAAALLGVGTATWTIDRSVEQNGLVLIAWRSGVEDAGAPVVDTYLRVADAQEQGRLVASIRALIGEENDTPGADDVANDTNTGSEA